MKKKYFAAVFLKKMQHAHLKSIVVFLLLISVVSLATGAVQPAALFTNNMVLQREIAVPVWGTAAPGEKITVLFQKQQQKAIAGNDGKWLIKLEPLKSGGPFEMSITGSNTVIIHNVYIGDVWLCSGQSNMDMTLAKEDRYWCGVYHEAEELAIADYPMIRVFDVDYAPNDKLQQDVKGTWEITSPATAGHFSAAAYFFARNLYEKYKIPIGLITTAYGASTVEAWTSQKVLESNPLFFKLLNDYERKKKIYDTAVSAKEKYRIAYARWQKDSTSAKAAKKDIPKSPGNPDPERDQHNPFVLYNGMVAGLIPYAIKGTAWYQGESNIPTKEIYSLQMEAMIKNWRTDWGQGDFPFIFVQLANYGKYIDTVAGKGGGTTYIREQQLKNLAVSNTAMVVAIDNADDPANIHPKNKQAIGKRLAIAAEGLVYHEGIIWSGPLFSKMEVNGKMARIDFSNADSGLDIIGDTLYGFAIAGADKKFYWANARKENGSVFVSSPDVPSPVAVRYGWGDNPKVNLYNNEGLPASPFRTDDW
jgi:sialate O-acetylesterase